MASSGTGRGRGRGRGILSNCEISARPGKLPVVTPKVEKKVDDVSGISVLIGEFADENDTADAKKITEICERLEELECEDSVKEISSYIYEKCLKDAECSDSISVLCHQMTRAEKKGNMFRTNFMRNLQGGFNERERMREASIEDFLGFLTILCQSFSNIRLATGDHIKLLSNPVFQCLKMILKDDVEYPEELICLATQLKEIGQALQKIDRTNMEEVLEGIRRTIINDSTSPDIREVLLDCLEFAARGWKDVENVG